MKKLEDKIRHLVGKQVLTSANALLQSRAVIFSYTDGGTTVIVAKDKDNFLHRIKIKDVDSFIEEHTKGSYTPLEIAALFHFSKYNLLTAPKTIDHISVKNKANNLSRPQAIDEAFLPPKAQVFLKSNKSLPHSSSTWETCDISVELLYKGRSYIGNTNKLRQLRFDETKSGSFSLSDFSSQDKQIIRFLSQYAEPDGSGYSLRSEIMAEFLHCLHGFIHFLYEQEKIIIHKESAALVGLYSKNSGNAKLTPALLLGNKTIPLKEHNIVVGRGGIWIGFLGEYWWVPATADVVWLRKFLLSKHLNISPSEELNNYPIKIIEAQDNQLEEKSCEAHYYMKFTENNKLTLSIKYRYGDVVLPIASNRTVNDPASFWKRDKVFEKATENELLKLGFKPATNEDNAIYYVMQDTEGIGLFLDKIYSVWLQDSKKIFILPNTVSVYKRIKPLALTCSNPSEIKDSYQFNYNLLLDDGTTTWRELAKHVKEKREYIQLNNKAFAKITHELSNFVSAFDHIIKPVKSQANMILIPKAAILYWVKAGKSFFKDIPSEWKDFDSIYENAENLKADAIVEPSLFHGELREYQNAAVGWMKTMIKNNFNIILADEMGLGKTVQALAFILYYKQKMSKALPCMVVCPTSLVENWHAEAEKFTPNLKTLLVEGINRDESLQKIKDFDLVITSYALIKRDIDKYAKTKFGLLILDEAQHIKNPTTVNAKVCKSVLSKHRLVLTGTPLENSPEDIWSIFDFLNPGMLGSRGNFKTSYSKIEYNYEKQKELADKIAPFILRRHKNKVEQLPKKIEQTLYCDMLDTQRELYNSILREGKRRYQSFFDGKTTRFDILTSLLRLRQLCCHPGLLPDTLQQGVIESAKTELLKELLLETIDSGQRTLVFSQFTSLLKILKDWLKEKNILYEYLDGSTKNRLDKVNNFNKNKEISLFLLSLKAGGTGLNLTGANTVIIYDPWWNPSVEAQATDRTHRIGQTKQVTSIKLVVKDSIEEKILELQAKKQGLFNGIIESSSSFKKLSDKDLAYLLN